MLAGGLTETLLEVLDRGLCRTLAGPRARGSDRAFAHFRQSVGVVGAVVVDDGTEPVVDVPSLPRRWPWFADLSTDPASTSRLLVVHAPLPRGAGSSATDHVTIRRRTETPSVVRRSCRCRTSP